jgi:hypothetical protein
MGSLVGEAKKAYEYGLYAATVTLSQMAVERTLRHRVGRPRGQLVRIAYSEGVDIEPTSLQGLGRLRNRIVHEGYLPIREEARWALKVALNNVERIEEGGLLRRLFRQLLGR